MADTPLSYKNDADEDDRLNPAELARQEQVAGEAQTEKSLDTSDDSLQDQEENTFGYSSGGSASSSGGLKGFFKKAGPTGGIVGIVVSLMFGGSAFLPSGFLFLQIKEVGTNYGSSASRAAPSRYSMLLRNIIGGDAEKQCASKPTGVRCRIGTMSDDQKKAYEKEGFKFDKTTEVNGRHIIKGVEFPDGQTASNGKEFNKILAQSNSLRARALRAFNPKTAIFNGGNRFSIKVLKPLGIDKSKFTLDGKDEKDRSADFDKKAGASAEDNTKAEGRIGSKLGAAAGKITNLAGLGCGVYGLSKIMIGATKLESALRLVKFASPFLRVADEIKASGNGGNPDIDTMSHLGKVLTTTDNSGPKKGLSATDSQGFKVAAYGGEGALIPFTQNYLVGGNKKFAAVDNFVGKIEDEAGGKRKLRTTCRGLNSLAGVAALCGLSTVVTEVATPLAHLFSTATCIALNEAAGLALGQAISFLIPSFTKIAIKILLGSDISSKLYGVDAGNALMAGMGFMLLKSNLSKGMKPSKKADVSKFLAATQDTEREYEIAMREDAKSTPLDVYNQYSFLGSFVRNSGVAYSSNSSLGQLFKNTASLAFTGVNIIPKTFADSMPVNVTDEDLSHCEEVDRDLADIGIDCDVTGGVQGSLSSEELSMTVEDNLDYMIKHDFVDEETGEALQDTTFQKWVKNCTDVREDVLGTPKSSPESDDYDWETGELCVTANKDEDVSEEDLSNFRVYYNTLSMKEEADGVKEQAPDQSGSTQKLGKLCSVNGINESSGVSVSLKDPDLIYTHNDEPGPIFGVKMSSCTIVSKFKLSVSTDDTESIRIDSDGHLWLADTGNNHPQEGEAVDNKKRAGIAIFDEPGAGFNGTQPAKYYTLSYPGGIKENVESLLINPVSGEPFLITKDKSGKVYKLPKYKDFSSGNSIAATRVSGVTMPGSVSDATFTGDGEFALVRIANKNETLVYDKSWKLVGNIPDGVSSSVLPQVEAIAMDNDGKSFILTSETKKHGNGPMPIVRVALPVEFGGADSGGGSITPGGSIGGDDYKTECKPDYGGVNFIDCSNQCVDFVLFRLAKHGIKYTAGSANGGQLVNQLKTMKYTVNKTPAVNSVLSGTWRNPVGHTAMVSKVNSDGSFEVEEYNFNNPLHYGTRTLKPSDIATYSITFAHTEKDYR